MTDEERADLEARLYWLQDQYRAAVKQLKRERADARARLRQAEARVDAADLERNRAEFALLEPYWGPGMTKGEAVRRYNAEHGEPAATPGPDGGNETPET